MNIVSILSGITLLASLTLAVEGLNWVTDGEVYIASLYRLAQSEPPPPPPPPSGGAFQPPPPPPGGSTGGFPPPGGTSGSFQPSGGFPPPPGGIPGQQPGGTSGAFGPPPSGGGFPPPPGGIPGQAPGGTSGSFGPPPGGQYQPQFGPPPQGQQPQSFPGGGATQGQFPSQGRESFPGSESLGPKSEFPAEIEFEGEQPFVNPQEIQNAKRNIKDLLKRISSIEKLLKKSGDSGNLSRLQEIKAELTGIASGLNASDDETKSDALQTFYDSNFHEDVQWIDSAARLPQEIKRILSSINRALKASKTAAVRKLTGLDVPRVQEELNGMKQRAEQIKQMVAGGEIDEAQEEIQEFHQGDLNPNMIESAVYAVVNLSKMIRQLGKKNAELKSELTSILSDAIANINAGEYESAQESIREGEQLMQQFYQSRSGRR